MMTAKDYLRQLQLLVCRIKCKERELKELKEKTTSIGSVSGQTDRVQTTPTGTPAQISAMEQMVDLQKSINNVIANFYKRKNEIIDEINGLDDPRYVSLLNMHYVPDVNGAVKRLEDISCIMKKKNGDSYSYDHIVALHGEALIAFQKKYLTF